MTIQIGDRIPDAAFGIRGVNGIDTITARDYFADRKVVLFAVPGAFTPTCHRNHLPSFVAKAEEIKAKGVDAIAVTAVNDIFVLDAWLEASGAKGKIDGLADGAAVFAKALGLEVDLTERGFGVRSQRYSLLVDNGVVKRLNIEEKPGSIEISGADAILAQL
ncbi:MAG: peroxiredoxin [Methylocystaceae bacterium]|nr:MAG: peroxiredoxin [Methylocystaceae bacterium]